ncbi:tRNA lysidine(34) synthetase [Oribacterium sp. WCC10]|uniref:tRNA lysidine(34) synthetase n=1 Tax=Oribacterium sp. WCC10 TaxID=1855343 RepID=UPI001A9A3631|nr:tRNA lysidine(34) synthetase [Oribacterium sp. WCC10]
MDKQMLVIRDYIFKHRLIDKGDCVLVGLSGGPDSVFLLYALKMLRASLCYRLFAVHVHHGIRGEEADRDMRFSEELCREWDIPFRTCYVDAPKAAKENGMSLEEAARILRYDVFENVRRELERYGDFIREGNFRYEEGKSDIKADDAGLSYLPLEDNTEKFHCRIAVAHHMDDQAETVLHNLVRGSGIRGLAGMGPERGFIIRPLLSIKREYILRKLKDEGISYVIDSTNLDVQYTRNHIRNDILPELKEINPEAGAHIAHTAEMLREADDFFAKLAEEYIEKNAVAEEAEGMTLSLPVAGLKSYPEIVRRYVMIGLVRRMGTPLKDWSSVHFGDMDRLIHGPGNAHLDLPYRMSADYRKKHLILKINQDILSVKRRKNNGGTCKSSDS